MTNPDDPVCPQTGQTRNMGLSLREHFAALALQGLLAWPGQGRGPQLSPGAAAEGAVHYADALIDALNAKPTDEGSK